MAQLRGEDPDGATPLEDEDLDGLIPTFVATRGDLNLVEQANIEKATLWAFRGRSVADVSELLSVRFANALHRRMFGDVWRWAGRQRTHETNIGVAAHRIITEMTLLFDDALYWHERETYERAERAVRIHHRLVSIHPYRNGNGRHARLAADLYLHLLDEPRLTWGAGRDLVVDSDTRKAYIAALRAADGGDVQPLLAFALK
jgi:Fic-DOC domain mobile mystery protein B